MVDDRQAGRNRASGLLKVVGRSGTRSVPCSRSFPDSSTSAPGPGDRDTSWASRGTGRRRWTMPRPNRAAVAAAGVRAGSHDPPPARRRSRALSTSAARAVPRYSTGRTAAMKASLASAQVSAGSVERLRHVAMRRRTRGSRRGQRRHGSPFTRAECPRGQQSGGWSSCRPLGPRKAKIFAGADPQVPRRGPLEHPRSGS